MNWICIEFKLRGICCLKSEVPAGTCSKYLFNSFKIIPKSFVSKSLGLINWRNFVDPI